MPGSDLRIWLVLPIEDFETQFSFNVSFLFPVDQPCWNLWWHCHWLSVRYRTSSYFNRSLFWFTICHLFWCIVRYVECTSAAIQALTSFRKLYPAHRREEVEICIEKATRFIEKIQAPDGSWFVLHLLEDYLFLFALYIISYTAWSIHTQLFYVKLFWFPY